MTMEKMSVDREKKVMVWSVPAGEKNRRAWGLVLEARSRGQKSASRDTGSHGASLSTSVGALSPRQRGPCPSPAPNTCSRCT